MCRESVIALCVAMFAGVPAGPRVGAQAPESRRVRDTEGVVDITRTGGTEVVRVRNGPLTALEILSKIAAGTGRKLHADPDAAERLHGARPVARFSAVTVEDAAERIAGSLELLARFDGGAIRIHALPPADAPERTEAVRRAAVDSHEGLVARYPDAAWTAQAYLNLARLRLGGGEDAHARTSAEIFARRFRHDGNVPEAMRIAAFAALRSRDPAGARSILARLLREFPFSPAADSARLLQARAYLAEDRPGEAILTLGAARRETRDARLRFVGDLLLAETLYRTAQFGEAAAVLRNLTERLGRDGEALESRVALFLGMCLAADGRHELAVPELQFALLTASPRDRYAAALTLSILFARLERPTVALLAARQSRGFASKPAEKAEAAEQEARCLAAIGLDESAIAAWTESLADPDAPAPAVERRMEALGELVLAGGDSMAAERIWRQLRERPRCADRSLLMLARIRVSEERWREAIEFLDGIPADSATVAPREARRLRGQCLIRLGEFERARRVLVDEGGTQP